RASPPRGDFDVHAQACPRGQVLHKPANLPFWTRSQPVAALAHALSGTPLTVSRGTRGALTRPADAPSELAGHGALTCPFRHVLDALVAALSHSLLRTRPE